VLVLIFGLAGIFADWIAPYNPTSNISGDDRGAELGALARTDTARPRSDVAYPVRRAHRLHRRMTSALVGGLSGLVIGVASAYFGGHLDLWLQRVSTSSWRSR